MRPAVCHDVAVRVLIAPDRFGGLLTAAQAAEALALGWSVGAPHDGLSVVGLTDGGPGFVRAVADRHRGELVPVTATDPWGRPAPATVLLGAPDPELGRPATAYLEAAQVCGAQLRRPGDDLQLASSMGLGRLLGHALDLGARHLVVGLTGSAVPDAGLGIVAGLGDDPGVLGVGSRGLALLTVEDLRRLDRAAQRLESVTITALGDLGQPLLGLQGVAAQLPDREVGQAVEAAVGHALDVLRRVRPDPVDLLTGTRLRRERTPGAGAGGGLGLGVLLLGGRVRPGPSAGCEVLGIDRALGSADLLVTGEAVLSWESLRGSPVTAAAELAQARGIPVVVVAGQVSAGRRETMAAGLNGTYALADTVAAWPAVAADLAARLAARGEAVARTWSPPGRC